MARASEAEVRLHGRRVGVLIYDRGGSRFIYEDDLAAPDHQVLGQIFEDDPATVRRARVGLPAWFANLLPEGALRQHIVRELGGGNIGDFTLLLRLGRSLPGAVTVHADVEPDDDLATPTVPPAPTDDEPLRHSLAGVQLKFSIASDKLTTRVRGGGGWWVAKLPDRSAPHLPVNEYLTLEWLRAAGFPVPRTLLVKAADIQGIPPGLVEPDEEVFLTERFDRTRRGPVHVEDMAQVADVAPTFKYSESGATYDSLGAVIHALTGEAGLRDYVRRLVAMLVVGNTDAHLKNWALLYPDGRTPTLAPVYDFHSLTVYSRYRYQPLALSLAGERVAGEITVDHLTRLVGPYGLGGQWASELVAETAESLRQAWTEQVRPEAASRFAGLADHYTHRLDTLPVLRV
jgi:serine/threonine-protein kinase HipA